MSGAETRNPDAEAAGPPAASASDGAARAGVEGGPATDSGRTAAAFGLDLPGVLGNAAGPAKPGRRAGTATWRGRSGPVPGSVRHSVRMLVAVAVAAVALLAVTDGAATALLGLAAMAGAGLCLARYVAGAGARDGDYRRRVRLLGSTEPVLGGWEWLVHNALGADGDAYFVQRLRPHLQRLFAAQLTAHHGTDLYRAPKRARELVGEDLWPWIDPSEPPPRPSVAQEVLRALLDRLEALSVPARTSPGPAAQPDPGPAPPTATPRTAPGDTATS